jgi:NADH-quinone oxidoreductase subunit J
VTIALFAFFAAITVGFGAVVAFSREVFRAAFALLGTLCGVAGIIALLGASTVAALQILIYVGGVFVLFLFAILVTDRPGTKLLRHRTSLTVSAGLGAILVTGMLIGGFPENSAEKMTVTAVTAKQIGVSFLTDNLLTFEAVSVLLLAGLVAAVIVVRKEME